jgi:hypothetical protein
LLLALELAIKGAFGFALLCGAGLGEEGENISSELENDSKSSGSKLREGFGCCCCCCCC